MKIANKISVLALCGLMFASCDMTTEFDGKYITSDKKGEILDLDPTRLEAEISGLLGFLGQQHTNFSGQRLDDAGYPGLCMYNDFEGPDMVGTNKGTDWFSVCGEYTSRTPNFYNPAIQWRYFYKQIKMANDIIAAISADTDNAIQKGYLGQAHAIRALDYFFLAQRFQFNYAGNEEKPCVPLVLETTTTGDNPRSSVAKVYEQVYFDINRAVELLEGYKRPAKNYVDKSVALALRARINLVCQKYDEAYADAEEAIVGFTPYSIAELGAPSFNKASAASWIWGVVITPTDIPTPERCYVGSLSSLSGASFTGKFQQYVRANSLFYNAINSTDVRKGWFVDADLKSPLINGKRWKGYPDAEIGPLQISDVKTAFLPYANVKFGPGNDEIGSAENDCDYPIIRVEEMHLIKAEAAAFKSGGSVATGAGLLQSFVQTYRDPQYKCTASSKEAFINDIWFQRRVELWGEGFGLLDVLRLNKNMVRVKKGSTSNFPDGHQFNVAANNTILLSVIPQSEISANNAISESDNNTGTVPKGGDGAGLTDGVLVK